jgi:hypothetical protein
LLPSLDLDTSARALQNPSYHIRCRRGRSRADTTVSTVVRGLGAVSMLSKPMDDAQWLPNGLHIWQVFCRVMQRISICMEKHRCRMTPRVHDGVLRGGSTLSSVSKRVPGCRLESRHDGQVAGMRSSATIGGECGRERIGVCYSHHYLPSPSFSMLWVRLD